MENNINENGIPRRKALGRGLEELFNNEPIDYNKVEEKILDVTPKDEIINVKLNELRANPYQPRKVFDEESLQELASSIKGFCFVTSCRHSHTKGCLHYLSDTLEAVSKW